MGRKRPVMLVPCDEITPDELGLVQSALDAFASLESDAPYEIDQTVYQGRGYRLFQFPCAEDDRILRVCTIPESSRLRGSDQTRIDAFEHHPDASSSTVMIVLDQGEGPLSKPTGVARDTAAIAGRILLPPAGTADQPLIMAGDIQQAICALAAEHIESNPAPNGHEWLIAAMSSFLPVLHMINMHTLDLAPAMIPSLAHAPAFVPFSVNRNDGVLEIHLHDTFRTAEFDVEEWRSGSDPLETMNRLRLLNKLLRHAHNASGRI